MAKDFDNLVKSLVKITKLLMIQNMIIELDRFNSETLNLTAIEYFNVARKKAGIKILSLEMLLEFVNRDRRFHKRSNRA